MFIEKIMEVMNLIWYFIIFNLSDTFIWNFYQIKIRYCLNQRLLKNINKFNLEFQNSLLTAYSIL